MATDPDRPTCCGRQMRRIAYGLPGPDLIDASAEGKISLGGCCVSDDIPAFECSGCGRTAGRIDDIDEHMAGDQWPRRST